MARAGPVSGVGFDGRREQRQIGSMPKRKEPELSPAEQYRRFKKAAKEAGLSNDEDELARAFTSVARAKLPKSKPKPKAKS